MTDSFQVYFDYLPAVTQERFDPAAAALASCFSQAWFEAAYLFCQVSIITIGLALLFKAHGRSLARSVFCACACALGATFVLGWNPFLLKTHYFPLLLAALVVPRHDLVRALTLLAAGSFWIVSSGSAATIGLLLALLLYGAAKKKLDRPGPATAAAALCLLAISVACIPDAYSPEYPPGAAVSVDNVLSSLPSPYLGSDRGLSPASFANYQHLTSIHTLRSIIVFFVLCACMLGAARDDTSKGLVLTSIFILVGIALDGFMSADNIEYSPMQVFARLIPGTTLLPTPSILLPLAIYTLAFALSRNQSNLKFDFCATLLLISAVADNLTGHHLLGLAALPKGNTVYPVDPNTIELSRSASVVNYFGNWITEPGLAEARQFENLERLLQRRDFNWSADAGPRPDLAKLAIDGNSHTRWRTVRPQQPGDWFSVEFDRVVPVVKMVFSVRAAPSDYSRGFKIYPITEEGEEAPAEAFSPWLGPLQWTADGYPYFGRTTMVIVDLPQQLNLRGFKLEQTANAKFDWTISEIKLWKLPSEDRS